MRLGFARTTLLLATSLLFACSTHTPAPGKVESASAFAAECDAALARVRADFHALQVAQGDKTVTTIIEPLNQIELRLGDAYQRAALFEAVHPEADVRAAAEACSRRASSLASELALSRPLYESMAAVDTRYAADDTRRYQARTLRDFRRAGIDQPEAIRNHVRRLRERIDELEQQFERNIREDQRQVKLPLSALAGMPADYVASHLPGADGLVSIGTDYPDYMPFMSFSTSDASRKMLYEAFNNRGYPANAEVLRHLLASRAELARLLGFADYASLSMTDQMAASPAKVQQFIDQLDVAAQPVASREQSVLNHLQGASGDGRPLQAWQQSYLMERARRAFFAVDASEIRAYFPYARTRDGIFRLVEQMFGVQIRPWRTATWHPSVEPFELVEGGQVIGRFMLDMHPRPGKYSHAAQFPLVTGIKQQQLPVAVLVCNFPGDGDASALLEHGDVETFLHEFGHLLHHLLGGQQRYAALSGVATEGDFVEAPSQMLEEWVWNPVTLALITRDAHGEAIPPELVERMQRARLFGLGLQTRQQLYYAAMSLQLHRQPPADTPSLEHQIAALQARYSPYPAVSGTHFYASFDHLGGYASNYYTYMWSDVISSDMFSRFRSEGLLNTVTADEYRSRVLAPGGSAPAASLVASFLGRPYDTRAFNAKLQRADQLVRQIPLR